MRLAKYLLKALCIIAALLAGCEMWKGPGEGIVLDYGMPPPPHEPTVQLVSFSYSPASPIRVGDELVYTVRLNHPLASEYAAHLSVMFGSSPGGGGFLYDDGQPPDEVAGDGIYTDALLWTLGPVDNLPATAHLEWADGAPGQTLTGPPLTVLPAEEGGE